MDNCNSILGIAVLFSMDDQLFGMSLDRFIDGFGIILIILRRSMDRNQVRFQHYRKEWYDDHSPMIQGR